MNDPQPIRAVAFDIDGTLYPNAQMYRASLPIVLRHLRLFRAFGRARKEIRGRRPISDLHRETAELVAQQIGVPVGETARLIEDVVYRKWETVLRHVSLYPGVVDLLEELRARGVRLGAMSDFPVASKLQLLGLDRYFDVAFSSEEIGYLKPNVEPFRELVDRLGVDPAGILYVGNSYHYDVLGAVEAGMRGAHLGGRPNSPGTADVAVRGFPQLGQWLLPRLAGQSERSNTD